MKLIKLLMLLIFFTLSCTAIAQKSKVMVMEIKDEIDPRMTRYVGLALKHATAVNADLVIIEMDTYGGVLAIYREIQERSLRPNQFFEGHSYFETVKTFFGQKFNLLPITALEYLEYDSLIFVSCYLQENDLTNYLFIISTDGNLLLKEKLDEHLKGIGLDTFFVISGYVFFVKNKVELVCYKIL